MSARRKKVIREFLESDFEAGILRFYLIKSVQWVEVIDANFADDNTQRDIKKLIEKYLKIYVVQK